MEIVKNILLVFSGSMPGVTVMCLIHTSATADRAMEKKGKQWNEFRSKFVCDSFLSKKLRH